MAITRGQMQRQLRRGGGIMNIAPREQFGLGSKLKIRQAKYLNYHITWFLETNQEMA